MTQIGELHSKEAMILRWEVGEMDVNGEKFDLTHTANCSPMVTSKKTGKTYILGWKDIVKLAIDNKVNEE